MMKRRKNKRDKFARMNEEERIRYMQHRAEFELEAKRRKQQLIAIFTKNKLKREEIFSKLNNAKINEKWRYSLRQIKCAELYENIKHISEIFEKAVRVKNETIVCLHKELKTADADHRKLQETHFILIDNIIGKFKQQLKILDSTFNLSNIKRLNSTELNELKTNLKRNYKETYNIIANKIISSNQKQHIEKVQNAVNILNIVYLEGDTKSNLVHHSFLKIKSLWDQLHKIIYEYEQITENKRKQYEYLKQQDSIHDILTLQHQKTYLQLQNTIENLKYHIEALFLKRNNHIARLKVNRMDINNKFKNIKHEIILIQTIDSMQIKNLIVTSNEILKHLQQIMEKSSTVLKIAEICCTLEPASLNIKKYFMQDTIHTEFFDTNIPKSYNTINKFWEQYNYIKVDNILLKKKGDKLRAENEILTHRLQAYITAVSEIRLLHPIISPLH